MDRFHVAKQYSEAVDKVRRTEMARLKKTLPKEDYQALIDDPALFRCWLDRAFRDHHLLSDILVIALTAVICGAKSWEAISDFGVTKQAWFRSIGLKLPNGIPSHDTFRRVFLRLDPIALQRACVSYGQATAEKLQRAGQTPVTDDSSCCSLTRTFMRTRCRSRVE